MLILEGCSQGQDETGELVKVEATSAPRYERDSMPDGVFDNMIDTPRFNFKSIGHDDLRWPNGVITVAFEGGSPKLQQLVEEAAQDWTALGGGIEFSFRKEDGSFRTWSSKDTTPSAMIRISFRTTEKHGGYWSMTGTLARYVDSSEPTMNYGGFLTDLTRYYDGRSKREWLASYERGTILHEFGHALSLAHEHYHPDCQADMNIEAIVQRTIKRNKWNERKARHAMVYSTYLKNLYGGRYIDNASIVSGDIGLASIWLYYSVTNPSGSVEPYYKSGIDSPCIPSLEAGYASVLSPGDKAYYLLVYG